QIVSHVLFDFIESKKREAKKTNKKIATRLYNVSWSEYFLLCHLNLSFRFHDVVTLTYKFQKITIERMQ
ncbi:hypothetical protein V1478_005247, partial [Vespula squamosa]